MVAQRENGLTLVRRMESEPIYLKLTLSSASLRLFHLLQVELGHFHHLGHDAWSANRIAHQTADCCRNNLPRQPELVLQPAALALFTAGGELVPVMIDLFLILA